MRHRFTILGWGAVQYTKKNYHLAVHSAAHCVNSDSVQANLLAREVNMSNCHYNINNGNTCAWNKGSVLLSGQGAGTCKVGHGYYHQSFPSFVPGEAWDTCHGPTMTWILSGLYPSMPCMKYPGIHFQSPFSLRNALVLPGVGVQDLHLCSFAFSFPSPAHLDYVSWNFSPKGYTLMLVLCFLLLTWCHLTELELAHEYNIQIVPLGTPLSPTVERGKGSEERDSLSPP